ncbi:MAG: translation initiation factor IF-3 [Gammaproteobacteria bacterium]
MNEGITAPEVFLIGADGEKMGAVKIKQALQVADDAGLDLVEIAPQAEPPVCRVMDYGKYRFEQSKKLQHQKKHRQVQTKEIKMRTSTDVGDYQIKIRKASQFLEEGDKVKFTIRFRGREIAYQNLGMELLKRVENDLKDAVVEQRPKLEGKQMAMIIGPKKK